MDVAALTKLLSDSPLAAVTSLLVLAVVGQSVELRRAHRRELALLERVVLLAERLAPLVAKATRKAEASHVQE